MNPLFGRREPPEGVVPGTAEAAEAQSAGLARAVLLVALVLTLVAALALGIVAVVMLRAQADQITALQTQLDALTGTEATDLGALTTRVTNIEEQKVLNGSTAWLPCDATICGLNTEVTLIEQQQVLNGSTAWLPCNASVCAMNAQILALQELSGQRFGNVVLVDKVYGDDATCALSRLPCLTITKAMTLAASGDAVFVMPGVYNETVTVTSGVALVGISAQAVVIQQAGVTQATDLLTLASNVRVEQVTLSLTSTQHVQLRALLFPGTSAVTAMVRNVVIQVDNSGAGAGTSDVFGVHSFGTGSAAVTLSNIRASSISVASTGSGRKRGILVDTAGHTFNIRDTSVLVTGTGTTVYGVETANTFATATITSSTISAASGSDVADTSGALFVTGGTFLVHSTAAAGGIRTSGALPMLVFADSGVVPSGTNYMRPGTGTVSASAVNLRMFTFSMAWGLTIRVVSPPGGADTLTATLVVGGVDSAVSATITGASVFNGVSTTSVVVGINVDIALKVVSTAPVTDLVVVVFFY